MAESAQYGRGLRAVVLNATVSDTAAHTSLVTTLSGPSAVSYVLVANGTLDGAWSIQVSNDYDAELDQLTANANATWIDITGSFSPAIAAVAHGTTSTQTQGADMTVTGFGAVKAVFTATAGSGTVFVAVKGGAY